MTMNLSNEIETRKSFIFFLEWADCLMQLSPEERLSVYDALMQYVRTGEMPDFGGACRVAFTFIIHDFQRADVQYQRRLRQRSEAGRKHRGNQYTQAAKAEEATADEEGCTEAPEPIVPETPQAAPPAPAAPAGVEQKREAFKQQLKAYLPQYGRDTLNAFYGYWTEPTPDGLRLRYELQPTWSTPHRLRAWKEREQARASANDIRSATSREREVRYQQFLDRQMEELDRRKREQKSKAITFEEYMRQRDPSKPSVLGS